MTERTDSRYARGAQRRAALVTATAEVVLEQGLGAVSHRAVAARAGLPLSATTYYFTSLDQLRDEALEHIAQEAVIRAAAVLDALPSRCTPSAAAGAIAAMIGTDVPQAQLLVLYERYLEAGRHPRLRPVVTSWNTALRELVQQVLVRADVPADPDSAALVLALADGAAVTALAEGAAPAGAVTGALTRAFRLLAAAPQ